MPLCDEVYDNLRSMSNCFTLLISYQGQTILSIYAETSVNLVFFGHRVAPSIYMTLQAIFAIGIGTLCAGIWSKMGRHQPSAAWKMGFGTMCYGLGTLLMILPFQLYAPGVKVSPFWLVGFYLIVIIGEAISYPSGNAAASALAPVAFSTQMMTVWGYSGTAGANLSTLVSNFFLLPRHRRQHAAGRPGAGDLVKAPCQRHGSE